MKRSFPIGVVFGYIFAAGVHACFAPTKNADGPAPDQREIGIDAASPKPVFTTGAVRGPMSMETAAILTRIEKVETSMTAIGVQVSKTYYHASASHHNKGVNEWAIVVCVGLIVIGRDMLAWINRRRNGKRRRTLFQN